MHFARDQQEGFAIFKNLFLSKSILNVLLFINFFVGFESFLLFNFLSFKPIDKTAKDSNPSKRHETLIFGDINKEQASKSYIIFLQFCLRIIVY